MLRILPSRRGNPRSAGSPRSSLFWWCAFWSPPVEEVEPEEELPANPIDFGAVKVDTPEAYAWIYIPDTGVNYPIMRSATDDNFYLRRNEHGEDSVFGSIFTQSMNALDFSDPVTLIYGHNTANHTMFGDVRQMEDPDANLDEETRKMINQVLNYPQDSAGAMMTMEYVDLKRSMTVEQAFDRIRADGYERVIAVMLSSGLSGTYNMVRLLAEERTGNSEQLNLMDFGAAGDGRDAAAQPAPLPARAVRRAISAPPRTRQCRHFGTVQKRPGLWRPAPGSP